MISKYLKLIVLLALSAVFVIRPDGAAAQFNRPGLAKTLTFPGAEVSRAARRRARRAPESLALPIPPGATEAPTGLTLKTNGLVTQEKFD
jgi:hypothetical protein